MNEDVIPQILQLPVDKIKTTAYSFTVELPITSDVPDKDKRGIKIDKEGALTWANSPDVLTKKTAELVENQWRESGSADSPRMIPIPTRRFLRSFLWRAHSIVLNSKKPTLSVKYVIPIDNVDVSLLEGDTGEVLASQITSCQRIIHQTDDIDTGYNVLAIYKNTFSANESTESWYSSVVRRMRFDREQMNTLLANAEPYMSSDDTFESLSAKVDNLGYKLVPKYINGIQFKDGSTPKLVLGESEILFKVNTTREIDLAKFLFEKKKEDDLYSLIEYDELNEYFSGSEEEWFSLTDGEKKDFKTEMERASRQLGNRIAKLVGSAECVISAEKYGLRVKLEFLNPKE